MTDGPEDGQGSSIWDRLRRRRVVQWGIAYLAGAWALLQVVEFGVTTFDWPRQFHQLAALAFLMGLPVALGLAAIGT